MQQLNSKRPPSLKLTRNFETTGKLQQQSVIKQANKPEDKISNMALDSPSISQLDSPTRRRKKDSAQKKISDIQIAHNQLNTYIDLLDDKVYKLIQTHEAEFLYAYRNHIKKVREQMEEIRQKALNNANSTMSQTQKIQSLEKQLALFREDSLKLFQKLNQKQKYIKTLKFKLQDCQAQKQLLEKSLKSITKRNKQLQVSIHEQNLKKHSLQIKSGRDQKQFFLSRPGDNLSPHEQINNPYITDLNKTGSQFRSRHFTTSSNTINSKRMTIRSRMNSKIIQVNSKVLFGDFLSQKQLIFIKINQILSGLVDESIIQKLKANLIQIIRPKKQHDLEMKDLSKMSPIINIKRQSKSFKQISQGKSRSFFDPKIRMKNNELAEYFEKSIQTVKKEITRRRGLKTINFYSQYAGLSLNQFKKVDLFRIIEILVSNQKVIQKIYNEIFEPKKIIQ